MKKSSVSFVCQECGYDTLQWLGKCPECGSWNSLREIRIRNQEFLRQNSGQAGIRNEAPQKDLIPKKLSEIRYEEKERQRSGFTELDGVLGGGIVKGSATLIAGDPGVGKSTLLLQAGLNIADVDHTVLYVSAEESLEQIKLRAQRILGKSIAPDSFFLLSILDTDAIAQIVIDKKPSLVIVDSIQTVDSQNAGGLAGSVSQIRYATSIFVRVAKQFSIPFIIVGHVTKEGMVAGPMVLSHMVDTVLFLEGEKNTRTRILRSFKNRFGPVDEVGIFLMEEKGLKDATNPEQLFLEERKEQAPGSIVISTLEGTRAFLVEVQALVVFSKLPIPRRVSLGIDPRRLELLIAVLQKHCNLAIGTMDIFVNVAGGIKISDPACDIGICLAIYASFKNSILKNTVGIAEVGLLGELRSVPMLDKRVKEAKKLGFKTIITPQTHRTVREVIQTIQ